MKFALFYEIPVPRPWGDDSELVAYQNTLEQAIAGDRFGWHAFWTVEHHFLQEYSHCSNPEVLYGAIAARTERIRLGYGVRLMPKPYNHPVRTAESVAVLDLLSGGRVDLGTGPLGDPGRARGLRHRPGREPAHVAGGHRARRGLLDQRGARVRRRVLADAPAACAAQAVAEAAPAAVGRHDQRRGPRPGRRPRPRPVLLRRRAAAGRGQAQDRHLPRRRRALRARPSAPSCTTRRPRSPWPSARPTATRRSPRRASPSSGTRRRAPARSPRSRTGWPSATRGSAPTPTRPT